LTESQSKSKRSFHLLSDRSILFAHTLNHASSATDTDDDNDGSISAFDMAHESRDDEDNLSPIDQTREE